MLFLYLDESGDLGFDFVNKRPSSFFVVCILEIEGQDENKRLSKAVKLILRRKSHKRKHLRELKGSLTPLKMKTYFYARIKDLKFSIYAVILDKKKSYQSLWGDKERIYSHIAYLLLEKIKMDDRKPRIQLVIDRSKSKENIRAFDKFILLQLKGKIDPAVPLSISHLDSHSNYCLQAVDLFCWGLFRKYETNDTAWYDVFKDKIKYENLAVL
ncbi:MAG: DUF3800 domain-containing protein [Candidatus Omnitrophota bacterium]